MSKTSTQATEAAAINRTSALEQGHPNFLRVSTAPTSRSASALSLPAVTWDEQLGITFTQSFASIAYNVTAVEQSDSNGYGPGYLLNGLSNLGYWYQVGLSWQWPYTDSLGNGGYSAGFNMLYEVFNTSGNSIFPTGGGGGLLSYSGSVNPGDTVLLSLSFSSGNARMYSYDWNTGASALQTYSAEGATSFTGLNSVGDSNGFFTGLMTEQWHATQYYGGEALVVYSYPGFALSSTWMWIDEWNPSTKQMLFSDSNPVYYTNPAQLHYLSSNGASEASNATYFETGATSTVGMTFSYSVQGGGTTYSAPVLTYVSNGVQKTSTLGTSPTTYQLDYGSAWSITNPLGGSSSSERWTTSQQTSGTVSSSQTLAFVYQHQYQVSFNVNPPGAGSTSPSGSNWYNAGVSISIDAISLSPYIFSSWSSTLSIQISNAHSASTTAAIDSSGTLTANFAALSVALGTISGTLTQGSSINILTTITGTQQNASLKVDGLPSGASDSWSADAVVVSPSGVQDALRISTTYSTPARTYSLTVTVTGNGGTASAQYVLTIVQAVPLTLGYSINSGSGYQSPTLSYTYNGTSHSTVLGSSASTYYVDEGSTWNITNPLGGSFSSERWESNQPSSGVATTSVTIDYQFYHQFYVTFSYSVAGGGTPNPPYVSLLSYGVEQNLSASRSSVSAWVDAGSNYSYSNSLGGNGNSSLERWYTNSTSGTIIASTTISPKFYHQFAVSVSFDVTGGTGFSSPALNSTVLGEVQSSAVSSTPTIVWLDANSSWSMPNMFPGSDAQERWISNSILGGMVSLGLIVKPTYINQYYVTIKSNTQNGGSIAPSSGWYNSGVSIPLSQTTGPGWRFEGWNGSGSGSFTGNQSTPTVLVNSPITEEASFYPGLTIDVIGSGLVEYSDGTVSGTVNSGNSQTIFVPPNSTVSLTANPSLFLYSFDGWSGANVASHSPAALNVVAPSTVRASFRYNFVNIVGIVIAAVVVIGVMLALLKRRR